MRFALAFVIVLGCSATQPDGASPAKPVATTNEAAAPPSGAYGCFSFVAASGKQRHACWPAEDCDDNRRKMTGMAEQVSECKPAASVWCFHTPYVGDPEVAGAAAKGVDSCLPSLADCQAMRVRAEAAGPVDGDCVQR